MDKHGDRGVISTDDEAWRIHTRCSIGSWKTLHVVSHSSSQGQGAVDQDPPLPHPILWTPLASLIRS